MNRRELLQGVGAVVLIQANRSQETRPVENTSLAGVKALVFDTFGTVVDWRGSITQEGEAWGKARGLQIDWARFADRWRAGYAPSMDKVRKGQLPWTKLDDLHRALLEDLLKEFHIRSEERRVGKEYRHSLWD